MPMPPRLYISLLFHVYLSIGWVSALPNFYQVNARLRVTDAVLELRCPLYQALPGDVLVFSDMQNKELLRVPLKEGQPAPALTLPVESLSKNSKAFVYFCKVFESQTNSLVAKTIFAVQKQMAPNVKVPIYQTFHYNPEETKVLKVNLGGSFQVECPIKAKQFMWFRAGGEHILEQDALSHIQLLNLTSIKMTDLGTYFCAAQPTDESRISGVSLTVKKFLLQGDERSVLTQVAAVSTNGAGQIVQDCSGMGEALGPSDTTTWERPLGVVHLGFSGKRRITLKGVESTLEKPYYCSLEGPTIQLSNVVHLTPLVRTRRSVIKPQFILRGMSSESRTATVECRAEGRTNVRYEWTEESQGLVGTEARQEVQLHGVLSQGALSDPEDVRRYTCTVFDAVSGEKLGESTFNGLTKIKQSGLNSIELSEEQDDIMVVFSDEALEMHCDIPPIVPFKGRDIQWFINGEKISNVPNRINMGKSSILGYQEMTTDRTGTYVCKFGETTLTSHVIVRERSVTINIEPKEDFKSSNINDVAEFHCRVMGLKNGGKSVTWTFIPEGATEEQAIPEDAEISSPAAAPATAFLVIENPQKRHEGQYICRIPRAMDVGKLIVEERKITVNPEQVTTRQGSTVRFFCSLTLPDGSVPTGGLTKLTWMRKDRKALAPGREEIISGTSANNAVILVIKNVDRDFDGVEYICTDGFREAEAKVEIQEVCGPGERSCGGDKCIPESLFCNGVSDCPDGSDEIPERCRECEPNQYACINVDGKEPTRFCYLRSWHCDGEDDCGNGFDELNCPPPNPETPCSNKYYICPEDQRPIPRSYLCDTQTDCGPSASDETDCSHPSVVYPPRGQDVMGIQGTNVTLKCEMHGRPPAAINWRFNWGPIKTDVDYVENTTIEGCDRVVSYLTLINIDPRASGMYTCEAVTYRDRVLAPDYTVNVGVGSRCAQPKFGDAAWHEDMCLDCYCSGVSNECTSLRSHILASEDKMAKNSIEDVHLVQYNEEDELIPGEFQGLQLTDATFTVAVSEADHVYLEGTFGLTGDLVSSYSLFLKANITLFGPMEGYKPYGAIVMEGNGETLYYCGPSRQPVMYTAATGYHNEVKVRLTERDGWFTGKPQCDESARPPSRETMMRVLSNVEKIRLRVNLYQGQEKYKLEGLRLEHVVPAAEGHGILYSDIEFCKCPEGYKGLSCEQCDRGYEHDPKDVTKCRPACACERCDERGNCLVCPENATGPDCEQCQSGFFRPLDQPITLPCLPCAKCGGGLPHVSKDCVADSTSSNGYKCRCEVRENGRLFDESCDLCKTLPSPPPEAKCEERSEILFLCNPQGTESITDDEICNCKEGYEGEQCRDCSDGFMKHGDKCLPCYCAGQTKECRASTTHFFENISLANPGRYKFDVFMSRKLSNGELVPTQFNDKGKPRIKRVYSLLNVAKMGPPEDLIVLDPITNDGLSRISIKLRDTQRGEGESDIPIYRSLYGGKMSFKFKRVQESNKSPSGRENQLIVEIESPKFGTVRSAAVFNPETQRYEVEFSEDWWNGGWRAKDAKLSRGALMRVLGTATSIGVSAVSNKGSLANARIGGLSLEVARDFGDAASFAETEGLAAAPVEICQCESTRGRKQSPSCEGCTDMSKSTVLNLQLNGPDFKCSECTGPYCDQCPAGEFKYDFLTNKVYDTCQKGLDMITEGRVVVAEPGSRVELTCRATSYRGGIPVHTWRLPASVAKSADFTIRRELLPFKPRPDDGEMAPVTSETQLQINNAKEEYSGLYECQVAALGTNLTEPFYLVIRDPSKDQPVEPGDNLNAYFPVPLPVSNSAPRFEDVTMDEDKDSPDATLIKGKIIPPSSLDDFHIVWLDPNGTQITSVGDLEIDPSTGDFKVRLPVSLPKMDEKDEKVSGFLVGNDPIKTPIWVPLLDSTRVKKPVKPEDTKKIKLSHPFRNLSFLEPTKIKVIFPDKKPGAVDIKWKRVNPPDGKDLSQLPDGMGVNRDGDLVVYAAGEEHEGTYETTITNLDTGDVVKLSTTIAVKPWSPPRRIDLPSGQEGENPEEVENIEPPQPVGDDAFVYYVDGFTPDSMFCRKPRWILVDNIQNVSIDISDRINRETESKFVINYPLASGKHVEFLCQPVPGSNTTGSLEFGIYSPDPRVVLRPIYDDPNSIFPTRLICSEGNPHLPATISISSDSLTADEIKAMAKPVMKNSERVELDWRRVGGFQPSKHAVKYTCKVETPVKSAEKTIDIKPKAPTPGVKDPASQSTMKVRVSSPERLLTPVGEDHYRLDVREGQLVEVVAEYDGPSESGEIRWSLDDTTEVPEITRDGGHSWARVKIPDMQTIFDGRNLNFVIDTPDGEKTAKVTLKVFPSDKPFAIVNLNSSSMLNGNFIGLTRGNMDIDVEAFDPNGNKLPKDLETFWRIARANGEPFKLDDGILAERYTQPDPSRLELQGLPAEPTEFRISAAVVVPMGGTKELFTSVPHRLLVREGLIKAYIHDLTEQGVLSAPELETVGVSCLAKDVWRNATFENAIYEWDYLTQPEGVPQELPAGVEKVEPDEATHAEVAWSALTFRDNYAYLGNLRNRPGWNTHMRCRAKTSPEGQPVVSDWFKVNVIPGDMAAKFPKIKINPTFDPEISRFPVKVECLDTNEDVPSTVTWTKDDQRLPKWVKVESENNKATLSWSLGKSNEFAPRELAGVYTCEAKNIFRTVTERLFLPSDLMDNRLHEKVPIDKTHIRVKSTHSLIEEVDGRKQITVKEGDKFELVCEYYGYPPPAGGMNWRLNHDGGEGSSRMALAKVYGLVWERGRNYWARIQSDAFNKHAPQTGVYICEALDADGRVLASDPVSVDVPAKDYDVKVEGVSDFGVLYLQPGGSGKVKCNVFDHITGRRVEPYGRLRTISWEGPMVEREAVKSLQDLAEQVYDSDGTLSFQGVRADLPEGMRAKCVFSDGKVRKESEPFFIVASGEKGTDGKVKTVVEESPIQAPNERRFQCNAFDTFDGERIGDAGISWTFVTSSGQKIPPAHLFNEVQREGNMIILTGFRDDIDLSALIGNEPVVEGYCIANIPETGKNYPSKPFMSISPKDADRKPEILDKPTDEEDKPVINIDGDDKGEVPVEEGKDVSLKCSLQEALPEMPKFQEKYTYHWQIARKDGKPVDTSSLANKVEVVPLLGGGLELKLTGLKASAAGLVAKCFVRNETDEFGPEFISFPKCGDTVYFRDDRPKDPDLKPSFSGAPEYDTIPENDKRNKYVVKIDGFDKDGRLAAPLDSEKTLKVKVLDKETGKEVPITDSAWKAAGIEVQHADGRPAPLSHLAKQILVDSDTGEIKLVGFKGDSEVDRADDLFVRVIAEKTSTALDRDGKPKPGQIGDPTKERYASPFIPVGVSDKTQPDDREPATKLPELIPIVYGLGKCRNLELVKGKSTTLSCQTRGANDEAGLLFAWELKDPYGQDVPFEKVAKSAKTSGRKLMLNSMKPLPKDQSIIGRCVVARKTGGAEKYYSRYFPVGPLCRPEEDEVARVEELPSKDPDHRRFRCVVTQLADGAVILGAKYTWEFSTPSGDVVLPGHIFESVEMTSDTVALGKLRSEVDIASYFGDQGASIIEGRCVAYIPSEDGKHDPKRVSSDPVVKVTKTESPGNGPTYSSKETIEDDKPRVEVTGPKDGKVMAKLGDSVTLKCNGIDDQTGANMNDVDYLWEVQTKDGLPVDSSALAQTVEVMPASDGSGFELRLIKLRRSANGLRLRCVLRGRPAKEDDPLDRLLGPGDKAPGELTDVVVKEVPDKLLPPFEKPDDVVPTPDDDPRKRFRVEVDGLDPNGNLASTQNSTVTVQARLVDVFTDEKADVPPNGDIVYGLEATNANGSPAPLNDIADLIEVDGKSGEFKFTNFQADRRNPKAKDIRLRVIAEINDPDGKKERFASPFIHPVLTKDDGGLVEDNRKPVKEWPELKPIVVGLSECRNLPVEVARKKDLTCGVVSSTDDVSKLLFAWELRDVKGNALPLTGTVADIARQFGNKLELIGLYQPSQRVFSRCVVARPSGDSSKYRSEYFEIGGECKAEPESRVKVDVREYPRHELDEKAYECFASDISRGARLLNTTYRWQFRSEKTGEALPPSLLFERVTTRDNRVTFSRMRDDVDLKALTGSKRVYGECIVDVPLSQNGLDHDSYTSGPKIAVDEAPSGKLEVGQLEQEEEKPKFRFRMTGLDDGKVKANEGANKIISCIAEEPETGRPIEGVLVHWAVEHQDGSIADTAVLAKSVSSMPLPSGATLRLHGIQKTASGLHAKCVAKSVKSGLGTHPAPANTPIDPNIEVESPYVKFDVTPTTPKDEKDTIEPLSELLIPEDFKFVIEGLGKDGNLVGELDTKKVVKVKLIDLQTGEELPKDPEVKFGAELSHADKSSAPLGTLAKTTKMDSDTGELTINGFLGDSFTDRKDDLFIRFTAERSSPSGDGSKQKFGSLYIPVKTLDKKGEPLPDDRKSAHRLPDIKPVVLGLSECGTLEFDNGNNVTLRCKAKGYANDDDSLVYAWELVRSGRGKVSMAGVLADSVVEEGPKLRLIGMRTQSETLLGHCLIVRKAGSGARFSSPYFKVGENCRPKSKTKVEVDVIPTLSAHERKFKCKTIDTETGAPIEGGNFMWEFVTSSGEVFLPSHIFSKVEINGDTIQLSRPLSDVDLSKLLGPNSGNLIMGRCRVMKPGEDPSEKPSVPPSDTFIVISPDKEGDDPGKIEILEPIDVEDEKPDVVVKGVDIDKVIVDENDSVTLTCEALDKISREKIVDLTYVWEVRTKGNRPVDTSAMADNIELLPTGELKLTGVKQSAHSLMTRCIIYNGTTFVDPTAKDKGALPAGDSKPGEFININVKPDPNSEFKFDDIKELDIDETDPPKWKVEVEGIDDSGALSAKQGDEISIKGKLINIETGEEEKDNIRFGIEVSYADGSPAPVGLLGGVSSDSKTGDIKINDFKGDKLVLERDNLRVRVVAERIREAHDPTKRVMERYASNYIPVVNLGDDGTPIQDGRPTPKRLYPITPTIQGLSPCGNMFMQPGYPASVFCKASNKVETENDFVFGWEFFNAKGEPIPLAGWLSASAVVEGSALHLNDAKPPTELIYGLCVVVRKSGDGTRYRSERFQIGGECDSAAPLTSTTTTTTTTTAPETKEDETKSPDEGEGFMGTSLDDMKIRFQITGINNDRVVVAKPGDDVTLTCTAFDADTNKVIPDATISWEFTDVEQNRIGPMRIAKKVTIQGKNAINFVDLRKEPQAGGRCLITLDRKATVSTPFFYFHITEDDTAPLPFDKLPNGKTPVDVVVEGLNDHGQISLKQIAQLTCKGLRADTKEPLSDNVRYGWEWRYLNNDPAMTSNIAVGIRMDGDSMELRGVRAPEGLGGRGVKGRCVVHVPTKELDPKAKDGAQEQKFTSKYFTVAVDHVPLANQPPVLGLEIDGITVEVEGVENGELQASQGSDAKLDCIVKNSTSGKTVSAALYATVYGWEFIDASGNPVDSSYFADAVNIEPHGGIRLSSLSAPQKGRFPMRIRCHATMARRLPAADKDAPPPRIYTSDFVRLYVVREDGTVTAPEPGQPQPDLQGNRVDVSVEGLHASGDLKSMPGEDVKLICSAKDKSTNKVLSSDEAIYDWSLLKPNGQKLSNGQVANEVVLDGPQLSLKHVKLLEPEIEDSVGRCEVFYNDQTYFSPFFKLDFKPKSPIEEIEGDGSLEVDIDGVKKSLGIIELTPEEKTIKCFAVATATKRPESDVTYDWEYQMSLGDGLPSAPGVMDPERVEILKEGRDGKMTIKGTSAKKDLQKDKKTYLRCRVTRDGMTYTSPFYALRLADEDTKDEKPEEKSTPKYWVKVTGLDKGRLAAQPGDEAKLRCQAMNTKTGKPMNNIDYLWELRSTDGEMVDTSQLSDEVSFADKEFILKRIKPTYGTLKGACVAVNRDTKEHISSPFFSIHVPPNFKPEDLNMKPPFIGYADPKDKRVKVWVSELNELGNINGLVGDDDTLKCNAESQDSRATVIGYSWEFTDEHTQPLSPSVLAKDVQTKPDGSVDMNGLRAYKDPQGFHAVGGRCLAHVSVLDDSGKEKILKFPSKYFNLIVRDLEDPTLPKIPDDLQGEFVIVEVDGLDSSGNLRAQPGDTATLTCRAKDVEANIDEVGGPQSWRFVDSLGRKVPAERLAMTMEKEGRKLVLTHLRPTNADVLTRGSCVVFSENRKRLYSSVPFDVVVKIHDANAPREDDEVTVELSGDVANGAFTGEKGGDGKFLCSAKYAETGEEVPPSEVAYDWEFEIGGQLRPVDTVAGNIAAKVQQTSDPSNPQVALLHLNTLSINSKWTRARCSATLTKKLEEEGSVPQAKTFYSPFFSSGAVFDSSTPVGPIITDPDISIRVHGADKDNTVVADVGDDRALKCAAIDMTTGLPIEDAEFTWDLRTVDNQPLLSTKLADHVRSNKEELHISGLKESSKFARVRCLASLPSRDASKDDELKKKFPLYTSPTLKFNVTPKEDEAIPQEPKIDISNLKVEVLGISPAGTLTDVAGTNKSLDCIVTDKWIGAPIADGISIGWVLATGPDNQPFELIRLADDVEFDGSKLTLTGLRETGKYSGGLRGQCIVSTEGGDSTEAPVVKSDVFAIHILPKPSVDPELIKEPTEENKGLPDKWIPGSEPKDAVIVIIHELNKDGEIEGNVGADATLTCVAYDTRTQQQLKVGSMEEKVSPRFGWELRDKNTGVEVSFKQLVSSQVTMTQTSHNVDPPDASAASRLRLEGLVSTIGKALHGRCTVSLDGQVYHSEYFPVSIGGKRVPDSVNTGDQMPGYYEVDNAVTVVVSELNSDGGKVVYTGQDTELTCTALNSKSKIPLPAKSVFYGWRLVNAKGNELQPGRFGSVRAEGQILTIKDVSYTMDEHGAPESIYGWCVAGVKRSSGLPGQQRYRSDTFIIHSNGEHIGEAAVLDRPDITVGVTNVGGDEDFLISPGEDIEMVATVTDAKTKEVLPLDSNVKVGWEWTDVSGTRPVDVGAFAEGGEAQTPEGGFFVYHVRLTQPVRGRAVVTFKAPEEGGRQWTFYSPFFFLQPDREAEGEQLLEGVAFHDAKDKDVVVKIEGLNDKRQFVIPTNGKAEITAIATEAASGTVLTKETEPRLVGYGWEVVTRDGMPSHSGDLADSISMDAGAGKLSLANLQPDGQQVLVRMTATLEVKEKRDVGGADGAEKQEVTLRKRYKSDLIPVVAEGAFWSDDSSHDLSTQNVTVTIDGLDENDVVVTPGEDIALQALVKDSAGNVLSVDGYSWSFIDLNGFPVAPSLISKSFEQGADGTFKLFVIQPSAISDGVQGRCRVAVLRKGAEGQQFYDSPWFSFKSPIEKEEAGSTDGPDVPTPEKDYGFTLRIKSDTSVIYPNKEGDLVMARPHLPLGLNCVVEFAEGVSPRLSESGTPIPQLSWYYRRPEIPGDVPIPAELYRAAPGKLETLLISEVNDQVTRISSDHYDFRDDIAEFECHAMDGDKTLAIRTVYINRVKERIRVQVFDENSRTAVYGLEKSKAMLSCYVEDELYGGRVDPLSYKWEVRRPNQDWKASISPGDLASSVTGVNDKDLVLDGLLVADAGQPSSSYQVRCVAQYNTTYFVVSRAFSVNVHRVPELKAIRLVREKPEQQELTSEPAKDIYDAGTDYLVTCTPDFFAGDVQAVWEKYDEEFDDWELISPPSARLFFVADSTEYEDEGQYRCRVSHDLPEYDYHTISTRILSLSRIAGPAPSAKDQQTFTVNDELMLQCTDRSASPQVKVDWSFKPSAKAPPAGKDPLSIGSYFQHDRTNVFIIKRGQLLESHSGMYTCKRTNEYGQAITEISVTVKPEVYEPGIRKRN